MMSTVGQIERATQNRVVKLFQENLGYDYLGDWQDRDGNSNIEEGFLRAFLTRRGYSDELINRALSELNRTAGDQSKSLYYVNKAVYSLLRYGVKVRPEAGEQTETVWLIDPLVVVSTVLSADGSAVKVPTAARVSVVFVAL